MINSFDTIYKTLEMKYIIHCLFYLNYIICVSYRMNEKKHLNTIKNYNYNITSLETDKTMYFKVTNRSHNTEK